MVSDPRYSDLAMVSTEFLGSLFLVMAAISPIILFDEILDSGLSIAVIADALAVGFILFALIEIFIHIGGAHFNPAVTFAFLIRGEVGGGKAVAYISSQLAGGLAGMLLSHLMFYHEIGVLVEMAEVTRNGGAFVAEILGTFLLVLAILHLVEKGSDRISTVVGMLVGGMLMATSSTMFANPQVTFARMFTYSAAGVAPLDGVVFILMELTGAALAVVVFRMTSRRINIISEGGP